MPRPATAEETHQASTFLEADQQTARREKLVIPAKVVYLGSNPKHSATIKGRVFSEKFEIAPGNVREIKTVSDESGNTPYPFWVRDLAGQIITMAVLGAEAPEEYRGRPFVVCEHPDHLVWFHLKRDERTNQPEYRVLFESRAAKEAFDEYARRVTGRRTRAQAELKETVG